MVLMVCHIKTFFFLALKHLCAVTCMFKYMSKNLHMYICMYTYKYIQYIHRHTYMFCLLLKTMSGFKLVSVQ